MADTNNSLLDNQTVAECTTAPDPSNSISQGLSTAQFQFLTVSYNPAVHPKQISLLDVNGQPIQYTLVPADQAIPPHMFPQAQPHSTTAMPNLMYAQPSANVCSICGAQAVDKCWYGTVNGRPCGRLLCLAHIMELPSAHGGRYPHCPEHYNFIKKNALCNVL